MGTTRSLLLIAWAAALCASTSFAAPVKVNPCVRATARCTADDRFLAVTYDVGLDNPSDEAVEVLLLPRVDVLEKVEGMRGGLVLSKRDGAIYASVPAGWTGRIVLYAKQRISAGPGAAAFSARVPMPPAVARSMTVDLPGPSVELEVSPAAIVRPLGGEADRSRFEVMPLQGDVFTVAWKRVPLAPRLRFSLRQVHQITENAPEFGDEVALTFLFTDSPPSVVSAAVPDGISVSSVEAAEGAVWVFRGGTLQILVPEGFAGNRLSVTCHVEGRTVTTEGERAELLTVPIFVSPEAERHEGRVLVAGGRNELSFVTLQSASQTAAEGLDGDAWRLACDLHGPRAGVVVRIVPMEARREAQVESFYRVSAFKVDGEHRVTILARNQPLSSIELMLSPGEVVSRLTGPELKSWWQDGNKVRIEIRAALLGAIEHMLTTERLTGGRRKISLTPPVVAGVVSTEYAIGISPVRDTQLKPADTAQDGRVSPQSLPPWLRRLAPSVAYSYRGPAAPMGLEIIPVEAEIRGNIQDHVTVFEDRLLRESLFLLDVRKRPVETLTITLPPGLTVERVDGPLIEGWELAETGGELIVRFLRPLTGESHFRLVCSRSVQPGRLTVNALGVAGAPHLPGWLAISSDVSVALRPVEDGWTNLASVATDKAPPYLQGFENRLLYEFYDSRWELRLLTELIPALYSAETLQVLRFRASQVEASALFNVEVERGGVSTLSFELPANASGSQFRADHVVQRRLEGGRWHVRFRGKRTGMLRCRIDYGIPTGMGKSSVQMEPVRLLGAQQQSGILLLTQVRPDVEVSPGAPPHALVPVEARENYPTWSYTRDDPALAAFSYRGTDWKLPAVLTAHPLSDVMLRASIPLAKLSTLVQGGGESLSHLRLYVANTSKQFLTVDLASLHPEARLIGAYVYGEPVKPFREGKTKLQLPLFTSERAARLGMSVIDITYGEPHGGLGALRRRSLAPPDLGLDVGKFEWTVRLPEGYRLAAVGGNMDKPVSDVLKAESLAGRLLSPVWEFIGAYWRAGAVLAVIAAVCAGLYRLVRAAAQHLPIIRKMPLTTALVTIGLVALLAAMLMPALSKARRAAEKTSQRYNLHNIGLAISMYRQAHDEVYPPNLQVLLDEGYVDDAAIFEPILEGQELVYKRQGRITDAAEVVAYFWPPVDGGVNVLHADNAVMWAEVNEAGQLVNPRFDKVIATAPAVLAGQPAEKKLLAYGLQTEELAEAIQLEEQFAGTQIRAPRREEERKRAMYETILEANENTVQAALRSYMNDHKDAYPESGEDLKPYVADSPLRDALEALGPITITLDKARKRARSTSEQSNLDRIGLGISGYREMHGGVYPPDLNGLLSDGYIADADILESPLGDFELRYSIPKTDRPDEAVAYFWERGREGANLLFQDLAVQWQPVDKSGNLINPRTGEIIVRGGPELAEEGEELSGDQLAASRYNLGLAYLQQGDYDRAEKNLRRALDLKEDYDDARRQLAQVDGLRRATAGQRPAAGLQSGTAGYVTGLQGLEERLAQQEEQFQAQPPRAPEDMAAAEPTPAEAAATIEFQRRLQRPLTKGALVKQVGGGRSRGALPIAIDFPMPATVSYQFVKPFLGRTRALVSFRAVRTQTGLLIELVLAAGALVGFLFIRLRNPSAAITYGGAVLGVALVFHLAGSPAVSVLFASTLLAMAACLGGELVAFGMRALPKPASEESPS